ncbi:MAG TPA: bifunctional transaldolase/phosoglucose isomerase [Caulobacteraceae bacterium]|nr:bifunctional transaldolase/phosoglucose isomerase [Caulobacteraceae bacterium]
MTNPVRGLGAAGQSVWLDYLHRKIIEDGELKRLIAEDGVAGLTSNPTIFEQAIGGGDAYDAALADILEHGDHEIMALYEKLAIADIQGAAAQFRPLYDATGGRDGYVSLEVSPYLAMDTEATIAEARRLWRAVGRPNLMIKVPGAAPGVPAIRALIGEGINVNVTLLFAIDAYLAVAEAHLSGLEAYKSAGGDISRVHGVASFFVSRIDGLIDKKIDARADGPDGPALKALRGKVAIANAKVAYQHYLEMIQTPRWQALAAAGAYPQRLLWASTGTKDAAYSDILYVQNLIGPETVDTMPPKTLAAFRDHGEVRATLTEEVEGARQVLRDTDQFGLDLAGVTAELVEDGVAKFAEAFDQLLKAVADKRAKILGSRLNSQSLVLPATLRKDLDDAIARAAREGWSRRLWAKDASLWTGKDEAHWLGWLAAASGAAVNIAELEALAARVSAVNYGHALLLGMGGSSLGPEVLAKVFGPASGHPALLVLDSTDPDQIARVESQIDPANTLYIVSSKSGSTLEPDILHRHFFALAETALGEGAAGGRFIAITDPGSNLETTARDDGFAQVLHGDPAIGGRYSVMSNFGMAAAAVLGLDVRALINEAMVMARACGASAPASANPGVELGLALGLAARAGRDKVTFIAAYEIAPLGAWLEQLLAESTGKHGKGLIPVDAEPVGAAGAYGHDRVFVFLHLAGGDDPETGPLASELAAAGHPVVHIKLATIEALVQEFVRWEIAVAVAGAVIGIDPFDQPDVEASKVKARELTDAFEKTGQAPSQEPFYKTDGVALYADPANADALKREVRDPSLEGYLAAHFARAGEGDYVGLLAWLDRDEAHTSALQDIRGHLRDRLGKATVLGFGPRFLHSTGQAYKGGPNSGVFLEVTARPARDVPIPGRKISFGQVEAAQAIGDMAVLNERGRRVLRIDLGEDSRAGLTRLGETVRRAVP